MLSADGSVKNFMDHSSEIMYQGKCAVQHMLQDVSEQKHYKERLEALHRYATELSKAGTIDDIAARTRRSRVEEV